MYKSQSSGKKSNLCLGRNGPHARCSAKVRDQSINKVVFICGVHHFSFELGGGRPAAFDLHGRLPAAYHQRCAFEVCAPRRAHYNDGGDDEQTHYSYNCLCGQALSIDGQEEYASHAAPAHPAHLPTARHPSPSTASLQRAAASVPHVYRTPWLQPRRCAHLALDGPATYFCTFTFICRRAGGGGSGGEGGEGRVRGRVGKANACPISLMTASTPSEGCLHAKCSGACRHWLSNGNTFSASLRYQYSA